MEVTVKYASAAERKQKVAEQETRGYHMKVDDYDVDWKPGEDIRGAMVFTDEVEAAALTPVTRDLAREIDELKARVATLEASKVV